MMHRLYNTARLASLIALLFVPRFLSADTSISNAAAPSTESGKVQLARGDEVWVVSTRHLCYPNWDEPTTYALDVRRYDGAGGWTESSTEEFCARPPMETIVYVHGNRVQWEEAFHYGWEVYQALAGCANASAKMRFVIWTWPSDQVRGPLRDIRAKADRADGETLFLGWFLAQQPADAQVRLLGYSYGSRIITGGLHLLAGGSLYGMSLPQMRQPNRAPVRVALLAAALDCDWLYPGNLHGSALDHVERMLILYNPMDPALQRYRWVGRCSYASALGYVGVASSYLGTFASKVEQFDVSSSVGRSHNEHNYFAMEELKFEVCRVLFHPLPTANVEK